VKNKSERGEKVMKKVSMVLVLIGILSFSIVTFAGWEITSHNVHSVYTLATSPSASHYNPNEVPITASFSRSVSRSVTISTSAGFSNVVEAEIGYSRGQTITDTIGGQVTLQPGEWVYWYVDWYLWYHYGDAQYRNIWGNITDYGNWSAYVPRYAVLVPDIN
jgi:hypothetical protein